jgi:hypothetical protein
MDEIESSRRLHPTARGRGMPPLGIRAVGVTAAGHAAPPAGRHLCISCDDCAMQATSACDDCVVSFLLRDGAEEPATVGEAELVLDADEVRVVGLLAKAGLVPELRYRLAG